MKRSLRRAAGSAAGVVAAAALAGAMLAARCRIERPPPRTEVLARLPATYLQGSFAVSSDFAHGAFQEASDRGVRMVVDGHPGPRYASLTTRSFAPGSDRLFYWARGPSGGRADETFLVAAGTPYPVGASRHEYLSFSPDGRRWAVVAAAPPPADGAPAEDRRVFVLVDGHEQGRWWDASVPAFSREAAHVAWLVAEPAPDGGTRRRLLVDGTARAAFDGVPGRCVSPVETDLEGARLPQHERVVYLSDGRLVVLVREGDGWMLRRDEEPLRRYAVDVGVAAGGPVLEVVDEACAQQPAIASGSLVAAKDAPALFWWERTAGRWRLVRDGAPVDDVTCLRPFETQPPVVSDDGRSWAYACVAGEPATGQELLVVTPHARHGPYREVWALALSDDGRRVAYGASPDGAPGSSWRIYADGVAYPPRYHAVWRPRFDPSGRHLAWEGIPALGARPVLAIDGRDLVRFDELVTGPAYLVPGWASWAVRHGRRLARINLPLGAQSPLRSASAGG